MGYTLFFDEERVRLQVQAPAAASVPIMIEGQHQDDEELIGFVEPTAAKEGLNLSEEELSNTIKGKWKKLQKAKREEYAQREDEKKSSHDELSRANYLMLAYREELLRWMVDLIRSPLPATAKHW